jgi:murein DD-endopeptidase MepM/ murein hydrolase activator NlpD
LNFNRSESLTELLKKNGFNDEHLLIIHNENLLPKGLSLSHGEKYRLRQNVNQKFAEIKIYEPLRDLSYIYWRSKNEAGSYLKEESFSTKEKRFSGKVNGSLLASIFDVLPYTWATHRFMDAYTFEHNLTRQIQKGAEFSFKIEAKYEGQDLIGYGEITESSLEIANKVQRRYFVRYPGGGTYVDPDSQITRRPFYSPVTYLRISSLFNNARFHPIKNRRQPHRGVDFELPEGDDVFSVEDGVVLRSGFKRAAGHFVVIQHQNGMETYYNHLLMIPQNIFEGAPVFNGQKIGEVGCTGYCTKAHLHFAIKKGDTFVDPLPYLRNYPYKSQRIIAQHLAGNKLQPQRKPAGE